MASEDNLLNKLVALVGGFDDASWEALASKGLVRRARKDLERLEVQIVDVGGESFGRDLEAYPGARGRFEEKIDDHAAVEQIHAFLLLPL